MLSKLSPSSHGAQTFLLTSLLICTKKIPPVDFHSSLLFYNNHSTFWWFTSTSAIPCPPGKIQKYESIKSIFSKKTYRTSRKHPKYQKPIYRRRNGPCKVNTRNRHFFYLAVLQDTICHILSSFIYYIYKVGFNSNRDFSTCWQIS